MFSNNRVLGADLQRARATDFLDLRAAVEISVAGTGRGASRRRRGEILLSPARRVRFFGNNVVPASAALTQNVRKVVAECCLLFDVLPYCLHLSPFSFEDVVSGCYSLVRNKQMLRLRQRTHERRKSREKQTRC